MGTKKEKGPAHEVILGRIEESASRRDPIWTECQIMKDMIIPEEDLDGIIARLEKARASSIGSAEVEILSLIRHLKRRKKALLS